MASYLENSSLKEASYQSILFLPNTMKTYIPFHFQVLRIDDVDLIATSDTFSPQSNNQDGAPRTAGARRCVIDDYDGEDF